MSLLAGIFRHAARVPRKLNVGGVPYDIDGQTIYGLETNRPTPQDAHNALPFSYYACVDTNERWQTDGSDWQHRAPAGVVRRILIDEQPRDTSVIQAAVGPIGGFRQWDIEATLTLGTTVRAAFHAGGSFMRYVTAPGTRDTYDPGTHKSHHVPNTSSTTSFVPLSSIPIGDTHAFDPYPYLKYAGDDLFVDVQPVTAPASGRLIVRLVGR